jgi:SRSO17 transposase
MDAKERRRLKPELDLFLARYAPRFGRVESQKHARQFVQGLLWGEDRRTAENIAEAIDGGVVRSLQKFLGQAAWQDEAVLVELRQQVVEELGEADAMLIVDEAGFPKKGDKSVGVARQYAGILGRVDNCPIAVLLDYASVRGHVLFDRRLFLPREWAEDRSRREEAGVPPTVIFRSKPELALEMVAEAVVAAVPFRWVSGDSVYGDSPGFVQGLRALEKWYVLDTSADARVWTSAPRVRPVGTTSRRGGRPTTRTKVTTKAVRVDEVLAQLPTNAWKRVVVAQGSQGPRVYEYAELTVWFSEEGVPSEPERLVLRRSIGQQREWKAHRSNAPAAVPLTKVARVAGGRWCIEQDIQAAKGDCGLDEYETRGWVGWHHHTALSLLALWFLVRQRRRLGEKSAPAYRSGGPRPVAASA